jgi:hypothetical protein
MSNMALGRPQNLSRYLGEEEDHPPGGNQNPNHPSRSLSATSTHILADRNL